MCDKDLTIIVELKKIEDNRKIISSEFKKELCSLLEKYMPEWINVCYKVEEA